MNTRAVVSIVSGGWPSRATQDNAVGSAIVRQWHLLTLLPRGPGRIDTTTLEKRLRARGVVVHQRTIQRDLVELARVFPLVSDERAKPYAWGWADDAELVCPNARPRGATVYDDQR